MALKPIKLNKQQAEHLHIGACLVTLGYMIEGIEEIVEDLEEEYPDLSVKFNEFLKSLDTSIDQFSDVTEFTNEEGS